MKRLVFLIVVLLAELLAVVALQGPAGLNPPALLGTVSRVRTWLCAAGGNLRQGPFPSRQKGVRRCC